MHAGAYNNDYVYYSDDGGESWTASRTVLPKMDEVDVATLTDGTVLLNMRNHHDNPCDCRAYSYSVDDGVTWSLPVSYDPVLISPECEGSLVYVTDY